MTVNNIQPAAHKKDKEKRVSDTDAPGFEKDIKPLFRSKDRDSMINAFDLWKYEDVVKHATAILAAVDSGKMPCDGPWPHASVQLVDRWIKAGTPA
jgi:hypothetical protein